ncbi:hypothetical protein ACTQ5J_02100 [Fundicoccus sp. Sow4_F4]|uniref:hypothetical protein n=1 Tax=Fundicoccus sp. Sow4_F4 TaxID=3438783 RepID=UPI003F93BE89
MGNPINNLGDYGWVTTAAKEAGGVDMLIQNIEDTAVELAKSGLVNRGRVEGAAVSIGALACLNLINKAIVKHKRNKKIKNNELKAEMQVYKDELKEIVEEEIDIENKIID